jgi:hydrogenase maturation protein HypF
VHYFGNDYELSAVKLFRTIDEKKLAVVREMLVHGINSPLTCGAGRIFDAVSALLMLCTKTSFDSEAPMRLESAISGITDDFYPFTIGDTVCLRDTFQEIIRETGISDFSQIAAKFHNTIAQIILVVCKKIRKETGLNDVVMSGGVFQNRYLLEKSLYLLSMNKFTVYTNHLVPSNDGGISLGQLLTAAERRGACA